jgi:Per os infectivity
MYLIVAIIFLIFIIVVLYNYVSLLEFAQTVPTPPLPRFDNAHVSLITPPSEIIIEGNEHECHKQLTPCTTHLDCDVCREGLANCQYFEDKTLITVRDPNDGVTEITVTIEAGESYCLALDRERARSCNPHTGVWLLAESEVGYSLLCSCLTPGLVTQLSLYHDCDVPIGCQPHGQIASIFETPIRCTCDTGFVADFDAVTQTPYCRARNMRDIIFSQNFPQQPCDPGYIPITHPGLDPYFRTQTAQPSLCVIDPCSVDPVSGRRHSGFLASIIIDNLDVGYCVCPIASNLFGVYNNQLNMVRQSAHPIVNTCIQPFNVAPGRLLRVEYKFFWGHLDRTYSDEDIVAYVHPNDVSHERYRRMLFDFRNPPHPNIELMPGELKIMKFSTSFSIRHDNNGDARRHNLYTRYLLLAGRVTEPCFFPGPEGRCITRNHHWCIRRHTTAQVGSAEFFTDHWCYLSRDDNHLRVWSDADRYRNEFPVVMRCPVNFATDSLNRDMTTVELVRYFDMSPSPSRNLMVELLSLYANYSLR